MISAIGKRDEANAGAFSLRVRLQRVQGLDPFSFCHAHMENQNLCGAVQDIPPGAASWTPPCYIFTAYTATPRLHPRHLPHREDQGQVAASQRRFV